MLPVDPVVMADQTQPAACEIESLPHMGERRRGNRSPAGAGAAGWSNLCEDVRRGKTDVHRIVSQFTDRNAHSWLHLTATDC